MGVDVSAIQEIIYKYDDFIVTGHTNPDGDAIGACYALGMGLNKLGKTVKVVLEPYHKKFSIIPGDALRYTGGPVKAQALVYLDCASIERAPGISEFAGLADITVCIDHHASNTGFARYNFVDPNASSTCELIFKVLNSLIPIDCQIGTAIYAGLIYDTGGFRHSSTTPETMATAAQLMALGIPFTEVYNGLCVRRTFLENKILGKALNNMVLTAGGKIAYTWVSHLELSETGATAQDLEGIVDYAIDTEGVEVAAFLHEKTENAVKCSLRSREIDVSVIAHGFGGGGHVHAAGCYLNGALPEVVALVVDELRKAVML